jgi:hypothetical protein
MERLWEIEVGGVADFATLVVPDDLRCEGIGNLEALFGEGWRGLVLSALLPRERTWAWWAEARFVRDLPLPRRRGPPVCRPAAVEQTFRWKYGLLDSYCQIIVPAADARAQDVVLENAGHDSDTFEQIWCAPESPVEWSVDQFDRASAWLRWPPAWHVFARHPIERLVLLGGGATAAMVSQTRAKAVSTSLRTLTKS